MKHINNFIIEALKIGSKSKVTSYDPDYLNSDDYVIYNSEDEDDNSDYFEDIIVKINRSTKNLEAFFSCRYKSLSEIQGKSEKIIEDTLYEVDYDLEDLIDKIKTGKDLGYEVRIKGGHIEIDCINSGSRSTYYIYAINKKSYDELCAWFEGGWEEVKTLDFLYQKGNILEINPNENN